MNRAKTFVLLLTIGAILVAELWVAQQAIRVLADDYVGAILSAYSVVALLSFAIAYALRRRLLLATLICAAPLAFAAALVLFFMSML